VWRNLIRVTDIGRTDEQEVGLFTREGLERIKYLQGALVVHRAGAIGAALAACAGGEDDGIGAAERFRKCRNGRMFQAEDERSHRG